MAVTLTTSSLILLLIFQLTTTIFGQECKAFENAPWSFKGRSNGPETWSKTYPTCGGMKQSPIMLYSDDVQTPNQAPLTIVGYDIPITEAEFSNDGIKVIVKAKDGQSRYIEMDGKQYKFVEFHFHWSEYSNEGSVHGIDDKFYDMEVHFVHQSDDGGSLAGMGVLYEATPEPVDAFETIVNNLDGVQYKDQKSNYQGAITLNDFMPTDRAYFSYQGSHTTPTCAEGVNWSVFKSIQQVGEDQMKQFPKMIYGVTEAESDPGCRIKTNVRPIQQLNGRPVYMYESTGESTGDK